MKFTTYLAVVFAAAAAAILAIANRQPVVFSLDPFSRSAPAIAVEMPLFLLLFAAVLAGVLLGGLAVALRRRRRPARTPVKLPTNLLRRGFRAPKTPPG